MQQNVSRAIIILTELVVGYCLIHQTGSYQDSKIKGGMKHEGI